MYVTLYLYLKAYVLVGLVTSLKGKMLTTPLVFKPVCLLFCSSSCSLSPMTLSSPSSHIFLQLSLPCIISTQILPHLSLVLVAAMKSLG